MIKVDKSFFDRAAIDTEEWLSQFEDVTEQVESMIEAADAELPGWASDVEPDLIAGIARAVCAEPGDYESVYRDNTYNSENDFDSGMVIEVFAAEQDEWYYQTVLVGINVHLGGDVRGNYGGVRWYRIECPAECGFIDWTLSVMPVNAEGDLASENYQRGYTSSPMYDFERDARIVGYSEKRGAWLAWVEGRACAVHFAAY